MRWSSLTWRCSFSAAKDAPSQLDAAGLAGEESPDVPGLRTDDWPVENPKAQPLDKVRVIRDEIKRRVEDLIAAEGLARSA